MGRGCNQCKECEKIDSNKATFCVLSAKYLETKKSCIKHLKTKDVTADKLTATDANIGNLIVENLTVKNLTITGKIQVKSLPLTLEVGADKEFKTPQDALNSLSGLVIAGADVTIKIYPGTYPSFIVDNNWFSLVAVSYTHLTLPTILLV